MELARKVMFEALPGLDQYHAEEDVFGEFRLRYGSQPASDKNATRNATDVDLDGRVEEIRDVGGAGEMGDRHNQTSIGIVPHLARMADGL